MNFIFVSPNFPHTYENFCVALKQRGVTVLGIGDTPYDSLSGKLRASLTEYYKVNSLASYDEMFRAVAWFSFKYGKIDWIESNNEFWLQQDARLRTDFHVTTGVNDKDILDFKQKSAMKKFYKKAGVPTARQIKVTTEEKAKEFIQSVKYPVIVKPDIGVGAGDTYKLTCNKDLDAFFAHHVDVPYVMEEFVTGDIYSYDAIMDSKGNQLFESSTIFPPSMMDVVNKQLDLAYMVLPEVPPQLRERGRATVKAFGVRSRFVHMEFFRLDRDRDGLGKKGDFVGLEVNMRPAGGYTPDMMDWAHSVDVYAIWADMVVYDELRTKFTGDNHCCIYISRRDRFSYRHSEKDVLQKYQGKVTMSERMPEAIADDLGNWFIIAHAKNEAEAKDMIAYVLDKDYEAAPTFKAASR